MFLYYKIILKITLGKKRHIFLKTKLYNYVMIIKLKKKLQSYNLGFCIVPLQLWTFWMVMMYGFLTMECMPRETLFR